MKETLFINLFGGPGTGKSTLCASIFTNLKMKQVDCEMALEYAKDVVWEESFEKLKNQIYIFGKQHSRIFRLNGKVDVVITDSPILLSIIYDKDQNPYLKNLILYEFSKLKTLNFWINRTTDYDPNGRMQSLEGAIRVDDVTKKLLDENNISYKEITVGINNTESIINDILKIIK